MKLLFVHPNFPGQYKHIITTLAKDKKNQVVFICDPKKISIPGVKKVFVNFKHKPEGKIHRYLTGFQTAIYRGQAVWKVCNQLKLKGFTPDIICAHPGWGDVLFIKDIFPDSPLINYCEFYYNAFGADVYFDPKEKKNPDTISRIRIKNSNNILNLEACDHGITPTKWQHSLHPKEFQKKISVIHEGINTKIIAPRPLKTLTLPNKVKLKQEDEIITYIARNLEPYRGFDKFMHTVEIINKERPNCHIIIVGNDSVSYGKPLPKGQTYKKMMLDKVKINKDKVHFLGYLPHHDMHKVLLISKAHVYLTVPFVLSWSMLEAMALECPVIGSDTAPVREIIKHEKNGFLTDFFSPKTIAKQILEVLDNQDKIKDIRKQARKTIIDNYDLERLLPKHIELIKKFC